MADHDVNVTVDNHVTVDAKSVDELVRERAAELGYSSAAPASVSASRLLLAFALMAVIDTFLIRCCAWRMLPVALVATYNQAQYWYVIQALGIAGAYSKLPDCWQTRTVGTTSIALSLSLVWLCCRWIEVSCSSGGFPYASERGGVEQLAPYVLAFAFARFVLPRAS